MTVPLNYYQLLGIDSTADTAEIKAAWRRLAVKLHPDTGTASDDGAALFILVHNAYRILADPEQRRTYDALLGTSQKLQQQKRQSPLLAGKKGFVYKADDQIYAYLNFIFWELEDFLNKTDEEVWQRRAGGKTVRYCFLRVLVFFDKWLLSPSGYPDYFMSARKLENIDPEIYLSLLDAPSGKKHLSYAGVRDYFYALRKRLDRFLEKFREHHLSAPIGIGDLKLIDCIIECQNFALYNLSWLSRLTGPGADNSQESPEFPEFPYNWDVLRLADDRQ